MPEQPLVSIIVPIYNAQDHIARCVESIRRQTYRNLEILLLNDGSQDVSLEVCKMYANVDPRIVLIDDKGESYQCVSNGVWGSLKKMFAVYGAPTYEEPINVVVKQVKVKRGTMLTLEVA